MTDRQPRQPTPILAHHRRAETCGRRTNSFNDRPKLDGCHSALSEMKWSFPLIKCRTCSCRDPTAASSPQCSAALAATLSSQCSRQTDGRTGAAKAYQDELRRLPIVIEQHGCAFLDASGEGDLQRSRRKVGTTTRNSARSATCAQFGIHSTFRMALRALASAGFGASRPRALLRSRLRRLLLERLLHAQTTLPASAVAAHAERSNITTQMNKCDHSAGGRTRIAGLVQRLVLCEEAEVARHVLHVHRSS